jgi:phosphoglycolate phosphatase-like HAD superfamily hydrolase
MTQPRPLLPSWRPGATRDSVLAFLEASMSVPVERRVATFDNDGTLLVERPTYLQFDFFVDALSRFAVDDPSLHDRPEYAAVLTGDAAAMAEIGLVPIAAALAELFTGMTPDQFTLLAKDFFGRAQHRTLGIAWSRAVYQPMLELIDELRRRDFTVCIVTGGGTEFVRAISDDLYGVPPERVVGTLIGYEFGRDDKDRPVVHRTSHVDGHANEGEAKVTYIQTNLGRRPILGVGNSGGDREMLEWACADDGPHLALLVNHDDAEREFQYVSTAGTFEETEPVLSVAARLGWTVVSMANDWETVFAPADS